MAETQIGHLTTKQFLSSIETKNELTAFLSRKIASTMVSKLINFVAVYGQTCLTNIQGLNPALMIHNQVADTSIMLHAIDASQSNSFRDIIISCSDTDVLLILLNYYNELCTNTIFLTREHDMPLRLAYEKLGNEKCKALLGFHAITGCDQTGKFYGFSKLGCWKTFLSSSSDVLKSLQNLGGELEDDTKQNLEIFVLNLYSKNRPASITNLG